MAKEAPKQAPPPPPAEPVTKKQGLPVKTIIVVVAMLVIEAGLVVGVMTMLSKPAEVHGIGLEEDEAAKHEIPVEIPVLSEKFTNNSSGRVWIWDTEILVKVKSKHAGEEVAADKAGGGDHGAPAAGGDKKGKGHGSRGMAVREELGTRMAEIRTGIGAIWSSAQHSYFTEPGRETLTRQVHEYLRSVFGRDAEGEERIQAVLIPRCIGFPADY